MLSEKSMPFSYVYLGGMCVKQILQLTDKEAVASSHKRKNSLSFKDCLHYLLK